MTLTAIPAKTTFLFIRCKFCPRLLNSLAIVISTLDSDLLRLATYKMKTLQMDLISGEGHMIYGKSILNFQFFFIKFKNLCIIFSWLRNYRNANYKICTYQQILFTIVFKLHCIA